MFFPGTLNIFVPGDNVFMFFKCMCNNISIEKKICMLLYTKWKMQIFDPIVCGNAADTANDCQMMSFSHVQKDLNRNKYSKLNLE